MDDNKPGTEPITVATETWALGCEVEVGDVVRLPSAAGPRYYVTVEAIEEHEIDPEFGPTLAFLDNGHWHYFEADETLQLTVEHDI